MATIQDAMAIGCKLLEVNDLDRAGQVFRKVVEIDPSVAQAWFLLGAVNQLQDRVDLALAGYEQALRIEPDHVEALNNLAVALHSQGKIPEALAVCTGPSSSSPTMPKPTVTWAMRIKRKAGLSWRSLVIAGRSNSIRPTSMLTTTWEMRSAPRESWPSRCAAYERALELKPDHPQVRMSRALSWLQMGDFERGWAEYEWRLKCAEFSIPVFRQPLWDGSRLDGRSILLYADHGLGDSLQFIRYAPRVKARGGNVIVACQQPLARLMATCAGVDQVVPEGVSFRILTSMHR